MFNPFKRKYKTPQYNSLPEFEGESVSQHDEDQELISLGEKPADPVTVTLSAQDRYRKLLERGREKPGLGKILASAAVEFGNQMLDRPIDTRQMHDRILGREKYREELERAGAEADVEKGQQAQAERERHQQTVEQDARDRSAQSAWLRDRQIKQDEDQAKMAAQTRRDSSALREDYRPLNPGEKVPDGYESYQSEGTTYVRPPLAERKGWATIPSYIIEAYPKSGLDPNKKVPPHEVQAWINRYNQEQSTKRNDDDNQAMLDRQTKADATRTQNSIRLHEAAVQRRQQRESTQKSGAYRSELKKAVDSYNMADRQLQDEFRRRFGKDERGTPRTPEAIEGMLWNDQTFLQRRKKLMDELVQRKNSAAQNYQTGDVYRPMDPKSGKEIADVMPTNVKAGMPTNPQNYAKPDAEDFATAPDNQEWSVDEDDTKKWVKRNGQLVMENK